MLTAPFHTPVLLNEVLSFLITAPDGTYVDATLGGAGHAEALLQRLGSGSRLIGLDADREALSYAQQRLAHYGKRCSCIHGHFGDLRAILARSHVSSVYGVLFDLGVSSFQLDEGSRGFSFRSDNRLDMRMNTLQNRSAIDVLRDMSEENLAHIFKTYGEERFARRIARRIVEKRKTARVETSSELSAIVRDVVGSRFLTKSLARIFQAIRIEVNDELTQLERGLDSAIESLVPGGRIVAISYHSLEDRIVKQQLKFASAASVRSGTTLLPDRPVTPRVTIITRKPVEASRDEQERNPRARSAKLRAAERV